MTSRYLSEALKKKVAGNQNYRCANKPGANIKGLDNYECLLWKVDDLKGSFDASGYDIDHIEEFCINKNNNEDNLQALCNSCHAYKTRYFQMNKSKKILKEDYSKDYNRESYANSGKIIEEKSDEKITEYQNKSQDISLEAKYVCNRCKKEFLQERDLINHEKRKRKCNSRDTARSQDKLKVYECPH